MPGVETCPRCGTARLIRRHKRIDATSWRTRVSVRVLLRRFLGGRQGARDILRHLYVCELCAKQWSVDELIDAAQSIDTHDDDT